MTGRTPVALIVGGASGIGLASARALVARGDHVVIADLDEEAARARAAELGDAATAVFADVTDEASVEAAFAVAAAAGPVRSVVSCAGLSIIGPIADIDLAGWQTTIDVCLTGTMLVIKHAARTMAEGGSVVAISSLNGRQPGSTMAAYCSAKAGVLMLVQVAALELGPRGIRVNAVSPGLVDTPLVAGLAMVPGLTDEYIENTPLGRSGVPDDIAATVEFLTSERAGWITGSAFDVNGGAHLKRYPDVLGKVQALTEGT
ncbi:SDR family NAD(P)-dependent oxidoreductase [[Mycobacterium] kokjensenii]|uniref:SDR family NAD(P)-dependent oxidoreductase n=1 Tax=[Mycobacterium] kokjensenii TaxID=3064287 RepID=A0ABM9L600_9MYCO|nr:SDR family NAD(P)-dependent oxidoreductase [Mycolicibacter sp. MU0083]CAJ1492974.1 SDR family NAD(P)-dependent oxidoreductase [Mycolicibacter sp. MU0083]